MLVVESISKTFNPGGVNERIALQEISLHLKPGEVVTIIGGNGAGKSTLLNAVAGVVPVDRGRIILDGQEIHCQREHIRAGCIGRVFQDPMMGTAASMTIEENLSLAMRRGKPKKLRRGVTRKERQHFKDRLELLDLGLEDRLTTKVGLLSGGQRQALTLLMATIAMPRLLLLDEHTAALDPKTAEKVLQLSRTIVEENKLTTMMVTHNMEQALSFGDRTLMLHDGKILLDLGGSRRKKTTVSDLLAMFEKASGKVLGNDRMLLN
ncbi:putative ABC transport system ATP-binding protein [Desulfotomaculum arcticum]|uniref:Putative ABC transport system ATP-binding protein n=1 Tax=Desulfotruncus arcticus DSM 17038 TaxID=1121424 RepID=A0A1I2WA60_9FIRM|nr:ATP-binding cassette domain-containing protein [Desulfotruncus arcticus]SFG98182.1 putative ABC transport system ATP-binding protein [Desulfotomaculum arcticum] [Desulfotruncus arcticus DSM 17038]